MQGVEGVDVGSVRDHVLHTLGGKMADDVTQGLVHEAVCAAHGDVGAVLSALQRYTMGVGYVCVYVVVHCQSILVCL